MIIEYPDGTRRYYYYKKKNGRHKKTGPKKKKVYKERYRPKPWDYKVVRSVRKKQVGRGKSFKKEEDLRAYIEELKEKNDGIYFPKEYTSSWRINGRNLTPYQEEYLILERFDPAKHGEKVTLLPNSLGKFVKVENTSEKWIITDRLPCLREETVWVFGHDKQKERKTLQWIKENLIEGIDSYLIQVYLFGNKMIMQYDDDFELAFFKNMSDAVRAYNILAGECKKRKDVVFVGKLKQKSKRMKAVSDMIMEKTGISWHRLHNNKTRY